MQEVISNCPKKPSEHLDKTFASLISQQIFSEDELCNLYMMDPHRMISRVNTTTEIKISEELELDNTKYPTLNFVDLQQSSSIQTTAQELDEIYQSIWFIPETYKQFDIAKFVIDLCQTDEELQRVGKELIMYQERDLFPLLRYLKYLVDTMRENNIVWGVGRGSSVSSYVLFLLQVHRIDSIFYDLSVEDFLKENYNDII